MDREKIIAAVAAVESVRGTSYALYQAAERLMMACEFALDQVWRRASDVRSETFALTNPDRRGEPMTQDERTAALSRMQAHLASIRQLLAVQP